MATEILIKTGTPIVWAASDFNGAVSGYTRTYDLDIDSLADAAARQGIRGDLGAARANLFHVYAGIEVNATVVSGAAVYYYWSESISGTAGVGNTGFCTGVEGAYTGSEDGTIAGSVRQLRLMGVMSLEPDAEGSSANSVQIQKVGEISSPLQYGQPVVWNESGQALQGDGIQSFVALVPIVDESQ